MLQDKKSDIKKQPKLDVGEEAECCRLVYEPGKGFALFHPAKDEEGGWLNIAITGRVGFDVIGANGTISICSSTHDDPLVTLDFATAQLTINTAACNTIHSFYIVDVAVAAVMTVATVEGRRLRAIQEDLDQILAYELATDTQSPQAEGPFQPDFDFSFATAVGRKPLHANKKRAGDARKKSGISRALDGFLKALTRFLKSLGGKKQKKNRISSEATNWTPPKQKAANRLDEFQFPFQQESRDSSLSNESNYLTTHLPRPPSAAYLPRRSSDVMV